jgi:hypothetical protein
MRIQFSARYIWIVVLCAAGLAVAGYVHAKRKPVQYTATAQVSFNANQSLRQLLGIADPTASTDPTGFAASNVGLASTHAVAVAATSRMPKPVVDAGYGISIEQLGASDLVSVKGTSRTPRFASEAADVYSRAFIRIDDRNQEHSVAAGVAALKREIASEKQSGISSAQNPALQTSLGQLETLQFVNPAGVSLVSAAATPTEPSGPHPLREGLLGLAIGLFVGLLLALAMSSLDPRLTSLGQLAPDVAAVAIPGIVALSRGATDGGMVPHQSGVRALSFVLSHQTPRKTHTPVLGVISSSERHDKENGHRLAATLAASAAATDRETRVLLLDLGRTLGASNATSLSANPTTAHEFLQNIRSVEIAGEDSTVISVDVASLNTHAPVLGTQNSLTDLLVLLRDHYGYVVIIFDPPESLGASGTLLSRCDALIAGVQLRHSRRTAARRLIEDLTGRRPSDVFVVACTKT